MRYFPKNVHKTVFAILEIRVTRHATFYFRKTVLFKNRKRHPPRHRTPTLLHNDTYLEILADCRRRFHIDGETPQRAGQRHVLPTQKGTVENRRRVVHHKPVAERTKLGRVADEDFVGIGIFRDKRHDFRGRPIFVALFCGVYDHHRRGREVDHGDRVAFRRRLVRCLCEHVRICVRACVSE